MDEPINRRGGDAPRDRGGRPLDRSAGGQPLVNASTRLPADTYDRLAVSAQRKGISVSEAIRRIVILQL